MKIRDKDYKIYTTKQQFTLFGLTRYDLVLRKRWMHNTLYIVDYEKNYILIVESVKNGEGEHEGKILYTLKHTLIALQPQKEQHVRAKSEDIAARAGIEVLSSKEVIQLCKTGKAELLIAMIREVDEVKVFDVSPVNNADQSEPLDNDRENTQ